jgi:MFS family permease
MMAKGKEMFFVSRAIRFVESQYVLILLFCICFLVSTPMNLMSPAMSIIATDLGFEEEDRDVYIGSYFNICYSVISLPPAMVVGVLSDHHNRVSILTLLTVTGGCSMIGFGIFSNYPLLLCLRVLQGTAYGAAIPVSYSLMGDLYTPSERAQISALLTASLGGGTLVAQLFAGYFNPLIGWRLPFVIFGSLCLVSGGVFWRVVVEPKRGALDIIASPSADQEEAISLLQVKKRQNSGAVVDIKPNAAKVSMLASFVSMTKIPTISLFLFQSLPNNVIWGVVSVHMHDFLITEGSMDVGVATSLIGMFGFGAAVGGLSSGILGGYFYKIKKAYLPLFMGFTCIAAGLVMQYAFEICIQSAHIQYFSSFIIAVSGSLAAINGSLSRAVFLNVTSPYIRGSAISILNLMNTLGRGIGPACLTSWMAYRGIERQLAMENLLNLWVFCGLVICMMAYTIEKDEDTMKDDLNDIPSEVGRKV